MIVRHASKNEVSAPLTRWQLTVLAAGTFVVGVVGFIVPGMLDEISADLHVSLGQAGQLTTAFALAYAIGSPIIATTTRRLERRTVAVAGMVVFLAGMLLQAIGDTFTLVVAGRIVSALGAAAFQATAFAVAGVLSAPERRARSLALIAAGSSMATLLGVPLGLILGGWWGWRSVMAIIAGAAILIAVLLLFVLPVMTLPAASLRETLTVFTNRRILLLLAVSALVLIPVYVVISYIGVVTALSTQSGRAVIIASLAFGFGFVTGNRVVGPFTDKAGARPVLTSGLIASALAALLLTLVQHHFIPTLIALLIIGFAGAFLFVPQQHRLVRAAGTHISVVMSLNGSMSYIGTALGAIIGGTIITTTAATWLAPTAAILATLILGLTHLTAPERAGRNGTRSDEENSNS